MAPFEPEGVYCNIPYRVLPDNSIEAQMPGGLVKFKNMGLFLASSGSATAGNNVARSICAPDCLRIQRDKTRMFPRRRGPTSI